MKTKKTKENEEDKGNEEKIENEEEGEKNLQRGRNNWFRLKLTDRNVLLAVKSNCLPLLLLVIRHFDAV